MYHVLCSDPQRLMSELVRETLSQRWSLEDTWELLKAQIIMVKRFPQVDACRAYQGMDAANC